MKLNFFHLFLFDHIYLISNKLFNLNYSFINRNDFSILFQHVNLFRNNCSYYFDVELTLNTHFNTFYVRNKSNMKSLIFSLERLRPEWKATGPNFKPQHRLYRRLLIHLWITGFQLFLSCSGSNFIIISSTAASVTTWFLFLPLLVNDALIIMHWCTPGSLHWVKPLLFTN